MFRKINILAACAGVIIGVSCVSQKSKRSTSNQKYLEFIKKKEGKKVSEVNLVENGNFEAVNKKTGHPAGWGGSSSKFLESSLDAYKGERSGKVKLTLKPKWGPQYDRALLNCKVDLGPGTYVFSCAIKGSNLTDFKASLCMTNADKKKKDARKHIRLISANTKSWKPLQFVLTVPKGYKATSLTTEFLGQRGQDCVASIDNVKLIKQSGSSNVMFNSSFELCTSPGTPDRWFSTAAKILDPNFNTTVVSDSAHTGSHCVKMTWNGLYNNNLSYFTRLMSGFCSDVEEGEKYTMSIWMKTDNPPVKMNLWMNYVNRKVFTIDSKEWKRYTFTSEWRRPYRKTRFAFILLFFAGKEGEPVNANVWVDDIMAEKGEKVTAWAPSPMDRIYLEKGIENHAADIAQKKPQTPGKYPRMDAAKTSSGIKVDGKLDESVWKKAKPANCEVPYKRMPKSNDTFCSIAYDNNAVYIGLKAKRKPGTKKSLSKSDSVFSGDWIEFFLDPNEKDNTYYQFVINEEGKIFTAQCFFDPISFEVAGASGYTMNNSWKPEIDYAISEDKDGWNAEIRLPLNLFKSELNPNAPFRLNFCRVNAGTGEMNCWSKPSKNFHTIIDYGYLDDFNPKAKTSDIQFSEVVFTPCPAKNGVTGRFSLSGIDKAENVEVELLSSKGKARKLQTERNGDSFTVDIPMAAKDARGKSVRIKAYVKKENKTPDAQAFSEVNIVTLLTLGINNLVFRDEKSFPCRIVARLPEAELKNCKLALTATSRKDGRKVMEKTLLPQKQEAIYNIPFGNLSDGFYNFNLKLLSGNTMLAESKKWTYLGKRKGKYSRTNVNNYILEADGKPFFMLSAFSANPVAAVNFNNLQKYNEAGLNCVWAQLATYRTPYEKMNVDKIFEMAQKNNIYVILDFCQLMSNGAKRHKYTKEKIKSIIKEVTIKYKDHPSLLMYHGMDEWWAGRSQDRPFCSDEDLEEIYWMARELDPYHAFFFNLGPRPQAWGDLRFTDVFSYDCYVRANSPIEFDLDRFIFYLDHGKHYAADEGKPMFNIIQFDTGTEIQQSRMLTYLEQRCLNYITILNDSKGLGYFTGICWCDTKNKELAKINKEIEALAPVLLGYEAQKRIKTPSKSIQAKWFKHKGKYYIIAVNASSEKAENAIMQISEKALVNAGLEGVFKKSSAQIRSGNLKLSFAPYECKVFKTD